MPSQDLAHQGRKILKITKNAILKKYGDLNFDPSMQLFALFRSAVPAGTHKFGHIFSQKKNMFFRRRKKEEEHTAENQPPDSTIFAWKFHRSASGGGCTLWEGTGLLNDVRVDLRMLIGGPRPVEGRGAATNNRSSIQELYLGGRT